MSDLSVLSGMASLKRLNIADSAITDLAPLEGLSLERLIFTPQDIKRGIDIIKNMASLSRIGTSFDSVLPPAEFWKQQDANE